MERLRACAEQLGGKFHHYDCLDSTNLEAKRFLRGQSHRRVHVFLAETQTAGRGRMGRCFHSPDGGLYLTLAVPVGTDATRDPSSTGIGFIADADGRSFPPFTALTALAVCQAVESITPLRCQIKWVNDVLVGSRKISGILCESLLTPQGKIQFVIFGIGINVAVNFPPNLADRAASLSEFAPTPDKYRLAEAVTRHLLHLLNGARSDAFVGDAVAEYRSRCVTIGQMVQPTGGSLLPQAEEGCPILEDIDGQVHAILLYPDGHREVVSTGELITQEHDRRIPLHDMRSSPR